MDNKLIKQLQEIKLREEDLFPNASPEDVAGRKAEEKAKREREWRETHARLLAKLKGKRVRVLKDIYGRAPIIAKPGEIGIIEDVSQDNLLLVKLPNLEEKVWVSTYKGGFSVRNVEIIDESKGNNF